jgi:L,D-peptidoglycan transpeptidase YkuD (ErfK/YbiS/YcfS/YnhG family)
MRSACLLIGAALVAAFHVSAGSARAGCAPGVASSLASTRAASQLVTVVAPLASSTSGTMRLWRRSAGCWRSAGGPWGVYLGFAGVSGSHHEGDGTTPTGAFALGPVLYGVAPDPGAHFAYHRLVCGDWWDEDPGSPGYNTFQHVACGTRPPFAGASEPLWLSTRAYSHLVFVEYNTSPAVPGRGSAIFIHVEIGHPTNGCVSLAPARMLQLVRWLRPSASPLIVIGTAAGISGY